MLVPAAIGNTFGVLFQNSTPNFHNTLYIFGVTLGLLVTAGLVRFGPSFENIAWQVYFFSAVGCIYYPIDILPDWLQIVAKLLLVHIFEEMRNT